LREVEGVGDDSITQLKLLAAAAPLTTGASPAQAAAIAGFDSQPAFGAALP
jgi:hypothetical protein